MHEHIDEMGIINMNGRIYDPFIGRFMSADPYIQARSDLQSYNRYAYVRNNPLNKTDPSGYNWISKIATVTSSTQIIRMGVGVKMVGYAPQTSIAVVTNVAGGALNGVAKVDYFKGAMSGSFDAGAIAMQTMNRIISPEELQIYIAQRNRHMPMLRANGLRLYRKEFVDPSIPTPMTPGGIGLPAAISRYPSKPAATTTTTVRNTRASPEDNGVTGK
jgi:RHS repeat-associated protein